jgi:hypothetical protein
MQWIEVASQGDLVHAGLRDTVVIAEADQQEDAWLSLIVIEQLLVDAERLFSVCQPLSVVVEAGAVAALAVGWLRPGP